MKSMFRFILSVSVFLYRLTRGRFGGRVQGLPVLLLTTVGRKSGKKHTTPLGYFLEDGKYVISATNAGFDTHPGWFHNLGANPHVILEIQDRKLEANAEIAKPQQRTALWSRLVSLAPSYAAYATKTSREIPMVFLQPMRSS